METITKKHADVVDGSLVHVKADEIKALLGGEHGGKVITEQDVLDLGRIVPKGEKRVVRRPCLETGEEFWLATSDLHQILYSPEVRVAKRKEKSKAQRKNRVAVLKAENEALKEQIEGLKDMCAV